MVKRVLWPGLLAMVAIGLLFASPAAAKKPPRQQPTFEEVFGTSSTVSTNVTSTTFFTFGDAAAAGETEAMAALAAGSPCWTVENWGRNSGWWGYWEYGTRTNWCHNGNVITYRYTGNLPARSGGFCSISQGTWNYKTGGGTNSWHVDVRSGASFSCSYLNGSPWMEIRYTYANHWQFAGSSG